MSTAKTNFAKQRQTFKVRKIKNRDYRKNRITSLFFLFFFLFSIGSNVFSNITIQIPKSVEKPFQYSKSVKPQVRNSNSFSVSLDDQSDLSDEECDLQAGYFSENYSFVPIFSKKENASLNFESDCPVTIIPLYILFCKLKYHL